MTASDLALRYIGLAIGLANKEFARYCGCERADLIGVALRGLVEAAHAFDASRGLAFSTYATHKIRGALRHYQRDHTSTIRIPGHVWAIECRTAKAEEMLERKYGRPPTVGEVAVLTGDSTGDIAWARRARALRTTAELFVERDAGDDGIDRLLDRMEITQRLSKLHRRTALVLILRHGYGLTYREVGRRLGISHQLALTCANEGRAVLRASDD